MTVLPWKLRKNLETSLCDFLIEKINDESLQVVDECGALKTPNVRVGFNRKDDWELPVITVYSDNVLSPRQCIGSNCRLNEYLIIIDIRALDIGMQLDLTDWVSNTINDGWNFYDYQPNNADPLNPIKTLAGYVSFDFVSNTSVRLGDNVDLFDRFRQNITISTYIKLN